MQLYKDIKDEAAYRQFKIVSDELASMKARYGRLLKYLVDLQARIELLEGK